MSISKASVINNQSTVYFYNKKNTVNFGVGWTDGIYRILTASFLQLGCLIGKPVYNINANNLKISLVVYSSRNKEELTLAPTLLWGQQPGDKEEINKNSSIIKAGETAKDLGLSTQPSVYGNNYSPSANKAGVNKKNWPLGGSKVNNQKFNPLFTVLEKEKLKTVVILLSRYLGTNVELDIVRIRYPYYDSNVLAQFIGINGKFLSFARIKKILFRNAIIKNKVKPEVKNTAVALVQGKISANLEKSVSSKTPGPLGLKTASALGIGHVDSPKKDKKGGVQLSSMFLNKSRLTSSSSVLTGIKFRISGRLAKQRVVPKRTVRKAYKGGVSLSKLNLVTSCTYTGKNKKGAFSIRVWLGHGIKN